MKAVWLYNMQTVLYTST